LDEYFGDNHIFLTLINRQNNRLEESIRLNILVMDG